MLLNAKLRIQLADLKIDQSNPHFVHSPAFTKRHLSGEKNQICYYTIQLTYFTIISMRTSHSHGSGLPTVRKFMDSS